MRLKALIVGALLAFGASEAQAQNCSGQPVGYTVCGNPSALQGLPVWTTNPIATNFISRTTNVVSAGGTTVLTTASTRTQNLTGTLAQTFQLPDATTLTIGSTYQFNNNSTGLLTITNNGGSTLATVPSGGISTIMAIAVSTANGAWDNHFWTPSNVQWGTAGLQLNGTSSGSVTIGAQAAAGTGTIFQFPNTNGALNQVLITDGAGHTSWTNAGAGTVSSVGLSMPGIFTVTGSPVTGAGTLTATLNTQSANSVWAGPTTGAASAPTFRALVGADLPNPSATTLGGVQSAAAVTHQWINSISISGVPALSQPAFTDISGSIAPSQCPNPSATTIGCVESYAPVASQWINTISTSGVPGSAQPGFSDLSGQATLGQLPNIGSNTILSNITGGTTAPAANQLTSILDTILGTAQGSVIYRSGTVWTALGPGTSGQVLTTNGASANPSWTAVTGTGTVTSIATNNGVTGGTITTSGTIGLAPISTGNVLANVSGISAAPSATTPTQVLDVIGTTQGSLLYRGASVWTALTPGTNGQFLKTTGAGSTPVWATPPVPAFTFLAFATPAGAL